MVEGKKEVDKMGEGINTKRRTTDTSNERYSRALKS